jgi:hypothetical protein
MCKARTTKNASPMLNFTTRSALTMFLFITL